MLGPPPWPGTTALTAAVLVTGGELILCGLELDEQLGTLLDL